jgi:KDO2-lipid IV(A) lauroyltransferase
VEKVRLARFWAPRYWPVWILWLGMLALARLPLRRSLALGRRLGRWLTRVKRREHEIARRNIAVCFRELSPEGQAELLRKHFESVGMSFVEMAIGWTWPIEKLLRIVRIEGQEHLERARAAGKGVLLVTAHFTTLEVGVSVLERLAPRCSCMYRPQRNAMMDALIRRGRSRFAREQISRDNVRTLLRNLKSGDVVVYLPDQTYLGRQSELLPFFGEPAVTNIATSKLASLSGAQVIPYFFRRLPDDSGYVVDIGPPFESVPSGDAAADARVIFGALESYIRQAPEQYLWLYKKFKSRPPPYPDLYKR